MPNSLFEDEQKVFDKNLLIWRLASMTGLIVIIKGDKVLGFASNFETAYEKALHMLGNQAFFLKRIEEEEMK